MFAWFLAGSGARLCERSRLLLSTCLLPGGVSPVGDIALRTPADARVCIRAPPSVRGLRPLPAGRAAGARGAAKRGVKMKPGSLLHRDQNVKERSPGLRAPAARSAPWAARAVAARCLRKFSFFCHPWRLLFDHFFIVAALGPESVPLICGLHGSMRWE